jgi:hypothetical protein
MIMNFIFFTYFIIKFVENRQLVRPGIFEASFIVYYKFIKLVLLNLYLI